ncbi:MAG TPA: DUF3613 domain-containing protein [Methylophilaceae bacterium]|nr:DUF3613 domain-containing protein [Methylophilaceae bacterium]
MNLRYVLFSALLAAAPLHAAEPVTPAAKDQSTPTAAREWLDLQSSRQAASPQAQPLSGAAMDKVHERYIKSFSYPVPPYFEHVQIINR